MTSAQVVETSVKVTSNSPSQDYTHLDDHNLLTSLIVMCARAGAGLQAGQAYGVFYLPGFRLAVPAPWLLSTQPPFAT